MTTSATRRSIGAPNLPEIRSAVESELYGFLAEKVTYASHAKLPTEPAEQLRLFLAAGGKRLRPILCVLGWMAGGGAGTPPQLVRVAASLELFHAFALIHDDIMDASDTRHGQPTIHVAMAEAHLGDRLPQAAKSLGVGCAILVGDMALCWSDELWQTADLSSAARRAGQPVVRLMRDEVVHGQYLDLLCTGHPTADVEQAMKIARFKSAKYTIERPLHLGAVLAEAPRQVLTSLTAYAVPVGEAFQLRDDLLGVFGAAEETGKPVVDDLRDGKHTALAAYALDRADGDRGERLKALLGAFYLDEAGAAEAREILVSTGAVAHVERMISDRRRRALSALEIAPIDPVAKAALRQFADAAVRRQS